MSAAILKRILDDNPQWVNEPSDKGETCLHVAGIYGNTEATRLVLELGANPNIRSTFEKGLKMHPLSWNVYGAHVDNAQLLIKYGADINAPVEKMATGGRGEGELVTVLDIIDDILEGRKEAISTDNNGSDQYVEMRNLLTANGAKRFIDLNAHEQEL